MFGLFKKKTQKEKYNDEYKRLMKQAYELSTTNRTLSDQKTFEANEILKKIEMLT